MNGTVRTRTVAFGVAAIVVVFVMVLAMTWAWNADAAPGDEDATFVPITACRLVDTRQSNPPIQVGPHATFTDDETKSIQAVGNNGDCSIPAEAVGLVLNITAVDATLPTFLTVWPEGPLPLASSLNPAPGQAPTPNAVTTDLDAAGRFNVYNLQGDVDVIIDVNGFYTQASLQELVKRIEALESGAGSGLGTRVTALEELTDAMTVETVDGQTTVRFTGVNVQVVDGSGDTGGATNGLGNLIVGYNQDVGTDGGEDRSGSHNLVVGNEHTYTSYGGLVAGLNNAVTARYASVSAGVGNTASAEMAAVSGGRGNVASAGRSSISGGEDNLASGPRSSILGGHDNEAAGTQSTVSGGEGNVAAAARSVAPSSFVVTARNGYEELNTVDEVVTSLSVDAPTDGTVTLHASTHAFEATSGNLVRCSITTGTTHDSNHQWVWESSGFDDGGVGFIGGTRTYNVSAGASPTYNWVCDGQDAFSDVTNSVLTAVFTANP